jgi:uncharacterized protein
MTRVWLFLLLAFATFSPVAAQDFPKLTGRVVDEANLLNPAQEAALTAKLEGLEQQTNRQLVVTTLNSLQGYEISDYGYQLGRFWQLGQDGKGESEKNNGAILIIAPNERRMRIEVGYGLEPVLTDGFSSTVVRNDITPLFKAGDYAGGINAGVDKIITQLTLPPEQAAKAAAEYDARQKSSSGDKVDIGNIIFWLFIFFFVILPAISPLFSGNKGRGRRHRDSAYNGPVIIWGGGSDWGGGGSSWGSGGGFGGGGGFSGGGGSFGGGGASGGW